MYFILERILFFFLHRAVHIDEDESLSTKVYEETTHTSVSVPVGGRSQKNQTVLTTLQHWTETKEKQREHKHTNIAFQTCRDPKLAFVKFRNLEKIETNKKNPQHYKRKEKIGTKMLSFHIWQEFLRN